MVSACESQNRPCTISSEARSVSSSNRAAGTRIGPSAAGTGAVAAGRAISGCRLSRDQRNAFREGAPTALRPVAGQRRNHGRLTFETAVVTQPCPVSWSDSQAAVGPRRSQPISSSR